MMYSLLTLTLLAKCVTSYSGYDSGGGDPGTCGRPYRAGKMYTPPCDLKKEGGYCMLAGDSYPWRAIRRFVRENQGLMKRMYGDQTESSLLTEELGRSLKKQPSSFQDRYSRQQNLDIDNNLYKDDEDDFETLFSEGRYLKNDDEDEHEFDEKFEGRYLKEQNFLNTKFVYSEQPTISLKLVAIKSAPYFRQASTTSSTTTEKPKSTTEKIKASTTAKPASKTTISTNTSTTNSTSTSGFVQGNLTESTVKEEFSSENTSEYSDFTTDATEENVTSTTILPVSIEDQDETSVSISNDDEEEVVPTETEKDVKLATEKLDNNVKTNVKETVLFQDANSMHTLNYKMRGVNACPTTEELVAPFWANNTRGEVLALLNMYPFEQYVHWEKCKNENKQMYCREGCRCEQQYRLYRMLAYDPYNNCKGVFSDWFRFPSCCLCKCYGLPAEFRITSRSPRRKAVSEDDEWYNIDRKDD